MITVINKANKGLYNQLFEEVQNWLYTHGPNGELLEEDKQYDDRYSLLGMVEEVIPDEFVTDPETGDLVLDEETGEPIPVTRQVPDTITSLEELFQYMFFITNFTPIYTRLPLDEEPFFIDADKRTISVPKDFAVNGVSVQGDEVAEILFFKINRFFDAQDFKLCDIFIQWKSSETDEFGNQKEGVSRPWIQDTESEPGYLIFGWPISSKITKTAGTVTFSVRLYRLDDADKLVYSFSTLDQTVKIQPALDYDIEDIAADSDRYLVDDMTSEIMLRAENSPYTAGDLVAEMPTWETWVPNQFTGWTQVNEVDEQGNVVGVKYQVMNLGINPITGMSDQSLIKKTAALSEDSGIVSYFWTKVVPRNGEMIGTIYESDGITKFYKPIDYQKIEDLENTTRIENKTYYTLGEGGKYRALAPGEDFADQIEAEEDVYEAVSVATIDEVGKYVAKARNRVGKVFSNDLVSDTIYVPAPVDPVVGSLEASSGDYAVLAGDPITLSVDVELYDEFGFRTEGQGGVATYNWSRRDLGASTADSEFEWTESELVLADPATDEGWYEVTVTNNLNKVAKSVTTDEIRVTKPAQKLVLAIDADDEVNVTAAREREMHLPVTVSGLEPHRDERSEDNPSGEDYVTYQWYWYRQHTGNAQADKDAAREGRYADDTNGVNGDIKIQDIRINDMPISDDQVLTSATTPKFIPPLGMEGTYFCVVTNHYNGTERSVASPFYSVTL